MKKINSFLIGFVLLFLLLINVQAQIYVSNNTTRRNVEELGFSAQATSETTESLNNGNKIKRVVKELIFKDSKGHFRRETESVFNNKIQKSINIRDPLAGSEYYLNPITKTAYRISLKTFSPATQRVAPTGFSTKSESLGKKIIEGFETTGIRAVTTIAAGTIGNEQPIEAIMESWFSPELRMAILSERNDPRMGEYSYEMKNINRGEPDASLFTVPADYKILNQGNISDRYFIVDAPR